MLSVKVPDPKFSSQTKMKLVPRGGPVEEVVAQSSPNSSGTPADAKIICGKIVEAPRPRSRAQAPAR